MELLIDNRESKLKEFVNFELNIKLENLDIGDFIYKNDNEIILLIERKTIADLSSSIKSGRYREQKKRILNSEIPIDRVLYLIEGKLNFEGKTDGLPNKTLVSSIVNLLLRDNIKVLFTKDLNDTFKWLEIIYNKIEDKKYKINDTTNTPNTDYLECIKTKKKDNLTPNNCYILQLSQIPGVSTKIATMIVEKYPTINELLNSYNSIINVTEKELLLSTITINNRKLGKVVSTKIYKYLFHIID